MGVELSGESLCAKVVLAQRPSRKNRRMQVSTHVLEAMGFKALGQNETVIGTFTRVEIFEVQGFIFDAPCFQPIEDRIRGIPFKFGFGADLNAVCKILAGDVYTEDEEQWKKDTRSTPPFMLVAFGPTDEHVASGSYFKEDQDDIFTFDSFSKAREELSEQVDEVVPTLLTALSLTFSSDERPVRFVLRSSDVVGRSADGRTIKDVRLTLSARGYVSRKLDESEIHAATVLSLKRAQSLDPKIARFHYLGSNEDDPLKRFLYFFLFVERLVHSTYSGIDHEAAVSSLLSGHARVGGYGKILLHANRNSWNNLRNRFIWCVMHRWTHLTDADIEQFEKLKVIRDEIAHGTRSVPDGTAVISIEALVQRIQRGS